METVLGISREGLARQLSCRLEEGRLCIWIHTPGSEGGTEVCVVPEELFAALARALTYPGDETQLAH